MNAGERNERLAAIVDQCLASDAAYKLFDMLASVARLEMYDRLAYIELVHGSGLYTDEEVHAIKRLIVSGAAACFMEMLEQVRDEWVRREIEELTS